MEYKVSFPECYKWMSANSKQYQQYIKTFLAKYHPRYELVRVEKYYAICKKK
jgi:hypothetical protein